MAEFSNSDKSNHGRSAQKSLEDILNAYVEMGYIRVISPFRIGKEGYSNFEQFYAPFVIVFEDNSKWALFTTTSMRTDRIKGQQWDAMNLKEIDSFITRVYLVYSDGLKDEEKRKFSRQNEKYQSNEEYSKIDSIISQDMLSNLIEEYAISDKSTGQIKDIQGNNFEERVARVLSYAQNLRKWKDNDKLEEGVHYSLFERVVECFKLNKAYTKEINATSDKTKIGRLPSGGYPKTDVLVEVTSTDGIEDYYTISCKRSSEKSVSIHQYNADAFADVLDKKNDHLRMLLRYFQECGSKKRFGETNSIELTKELSPYVDKLSMWALGGHGGDGDPQKQVADYILTYDNNTGEASISRIEDYCKHLVEFGAEGFFGTPFSWTYPSKHRGEYIQLKTKIIGENGESD